MSVVGKVSLSRVPVVWQRGLEPGYQLSGATSTLPSWNPQLGLTWRSLVLWRARKLRQESYSWFAHVLSGLRCARWLSDAHPWTRTCTLLVLRYLVGWGVSINFITYNPLKSEQIMCYKMIKIDLIILKSQKAPKILPEEAPQMTTTLPPRCLVKVSCEYWLFCVMKTYATITTNADDRPSVLISILWYWGRG